MKVLLALIFVVLAAVLVIAGWQYLAMIKDWLIWIVAIVIIAALVLGGH